MADDGMLVNFSIENEILRSKPVFKGGRWRDRLSAKRSTQRQKSKSAGANGGKENIDDETHQTDISPARGLKRQKLEKDHTTVNGTDPQPTTNGNALVSSENPPLKRQKPTSTTRNPPKEVISSLFSYNPSSATSQYPEGPPGSEPTPSNAALADPLSTFTSLGLSVPLSNHILTKFSLKAPTAIQYTAIKQLLSDDSDAFIQAETGSGKTLGYLLPIVQHIMSLSSSPSPAEKDLQEAPQEGGSTGDDKIHRTSGLFCIILAPTRELSTQISKVLSLLLQRVPYIVSGTVIGGEKKKSEKARLRKGLNILVATPGRLADHLSNTEALDVSQVRWLVLDEGDRLMELGFEEEIKGIVEKLEKRAGTWLKDSQVNLGAETIKIRQIRMTAVSGQWGRTQKVVTAREDGLPRRRITILCSATMKMTVQRLGEISLKDAVHIKAEPKPGYPNGEANPDIAPQEPSGQEAFQAPTQLKQSYIIVPAKQRLVTLTALLKQSFARRGTIMKAIVFLSCADSVDFHFEIFTRPITSTDTSTDPSTSSTSTTTPTTTAPSPLLSPHAHLHRLHGSLTQSLRTSTLRAFTQSTSPSILLCTDVASRGLDLPNIDLVIEYDPAFSADDHLHRIGRTARAGKPGRAECFLMPGPEENYVTILQEGAAGGGRVQRRDAEEVLKKGFSAGNSSDKDQGEKWDDAATNFQLDIERWVIDDKRAGEMARKAFVSHVRAYATHIVKERGMFDVKALHLGHLAKAFALRERPGSMGRGSAGGLIGSKSATRARGEKRKAGAEADGNARAGAGQSGRADMEPGMAEGRDAAKKMRAKIREHMAAASEFNIG